MKISPLYLITGMGMVGVAVVSVVWITGAGAAWSALLFGVAVWIIAFTQKMAWAARFNTSIFNLIRSRLPAKFTGPASWSYVGLLTGFFECGIAMVFVFLLPVLNQANWLNTLAFGVGFGAAEALFLGLGQLAYVGYYMRYPESLSENERNRLAITTDSLLMIPVGIMERAATMPIHIFTKALIILAVQQNVFLYFLLSFAFKVLVNGMAGWMHLEKDIKNVTRPAQWWAYELIFIIMALVSIAGIRSMK